MFVDSHTHLDFEEYRDDLDSVIRRAREAGVELIINVGTDVDSCRRSLDITRAYDMVFTSIGIHPHEADAVGDEDITELRALCSQPKVVAIGETGLDFYRNYSSCDNQTRLFAELLAIARDVNLPVILHSREAHSRTIEILRSEMPLPIRGVAHCFSGNEGELKQYLSLGLYVSIAGPVTFPNARRLREVARLVPPERLLIETDCPYLAPQIHRGKRNEPSFVRYVAETLAELHNMRVEDIARITRDNARTLFGIGIATAKH